jgi:hypothetical protein
MRLQCIILVVCISLQDLIFGNAEIITHANTTRLCRNECEMSSISFQRLFSIATNCGSVSSFYGCRIEIDVNYTRHTVHVKFSGYMEDSIEMYLVDYDYSIDEALNLAFYRNLFRSTVIFTCLTQDYCTDEYASIVIQRLIDSESILYELLPIYLDKSLENRTITCVNTMNDEVECYGGYCESLTYEVASWSYHDCRYPSESSVLSTTELTSLTAFFIEFEPENQLTEHINDNKMTLLCNVDLCNSPETRNLSALILDRYNTAAFDFSKNDTASTTLAPLPSTTTLYSSISQESSTGTESSIVTEFSTVTELFTITDSSSFNSTTITNQPSTGKSLTILGLYSLYIYVK